MFEFITQVGSNLIQLLIAVLFFGYAGAILLGFFISIIIRVFGGK